MILRAVQETEGTPSRILDAAERVFARAGFEGAGMKAIAVEAGVAQALLHYHFGGKEALYGAVVARRSSAINAERLAALRAVDLSAPDALEGVMAALLRPALGAAGGGAGYARIFGALAANTERDAALVAEHYDPTARVFIDAISEAADSSREAAAWGYSLAIGALVAVVGRSGRTERLGGRDTLADEEEVAARLVAFTAAGVRALCGPPEG